MVTGSEISAVLSGAAKAGLRPPPYAQYSRPDEVALFVNHYSVMSSSTGSVSHVLRLLPH